MRFSIEKWGKKHSLGIYFLYGNKTDVQNHKPNNVTEGEDCRETLEKVSRQREGEAGSVSRWA